MDFDLEQAMTFAVCAFKQNNQQYINNGSINSNKNIMMTHLGLLREGQMPFVDHVEEVSAETARHIITYYRRLTLKAMAGKINDFEQRVLDVIQKGTVDRRDFGVIASLPKSYFRSVERDKTDMELRTLSNSSSFIGSEGEEVSGTIRILHTSYIQKLQCYVVNAVMDDNIVVFFTKHGKEHWGDTCTIKDKVKRHQTSKFHKGNETVLNYVKVINA